MNRELLDSIVNAVLYEGYILYPYRASSKKNQRERFTFGRVYPNDYSKAQNGIEPCMMQTQCLVRNESNDAVLQVSLRFLQPLARRQDGQIWLEALEREVALPLVSLNDAAGRTHRFEFPAVETVEGTVSRKHEHIAGRVELEIEFVEPDAAKITVRIINNTPVSGDQLLNSDEVIIRTFASTHTILHTRGGQFVSLLDPDPQYIDLAKSCRNIGTWPVLVGDEGSHDRDTMLSSPIILYDYPSIASESPGQLFDGTEIDEILTLRVQTMTDQEKMEMRGIDEHARKILERVENLSPGQFQQMHGTMRNIRPLGEDYFNPAKRVDSATVLGVDLKAGDRVRIRPKKRADVMDIALDGKIGIIEAVEQDVDNQIHFALILEDDPGKDLGLMRQPGHRFFYGADEVEPLGG